MHKACAIDQKKEIVRALATSVTTLHPKGSLSHTLSHTLCHTHTHTHTKTERDGTRPRSLGEHPNPYTLNP